MPPEDTAEAVILRHTAAAFKAASRDADSLSTAARCANGRAPAPDEWDVLLMGYTSANTFLRARWMATERHHITLRIMQVDGRWVAMPSGTLDRSTLILLTHATTWAGVVLDLLAAHEERASSPLNAVSSG